jgi:hypothetical protein
MSFLSILPPDSLTNVRKLFQLLSEETIIKRERVI